jgi:hypothetical protein
VSYCCLAICIPEYLEAKRRIMETQIFHHAKVYSSKNPLKETKILQDMKSKILFGIEKQK